jgi:carbamoyltransferase
VPLILGVNAVFHDPAAALLVDGEIVAAAEEERFSRRKHGKPSVPFSTWELPEQAMAFCLSAAGVEPGDLDAVGYSYDPALAPAGDGDVTADEWEGLRTLYARRAPRFLQTSLPGLDPERVRWVPHHAAHAASATYASGFERCAVLPTAAASAPRIWPGTSGAGSSRCWPPSRCRTRSACSTRS